MTESREEKSRDGETGGTRRQTTRQFDVQREGLSLNLPYMRTPLGGPSITYDTRTPRARRLLLGLLLLLPRPHRLHLFDFACGASGKVRGRGTRWSAALRR